MPMYLLDSYINKENQQVEGFCLIRSVTEKLNTKGTPYLDLVLADGGGEVSAKLWDYSPEQSGSYSIDDIVKVRATVTLWRDVKQLRVERIRKLDPDKDTSVRIDKLVPSAPYDSQYMYSELLECAKGLRDKEISAVVCRVLTDAHDKLMSWPAAFKLHHAIRGGLLFHSFSMLKSAKHICEVYPALDTDLVYAGIILHDMAKVFELSASTSGLSTGYSIRGHLIGHIALGVANLERVCTELGTSVQVKTLLQHMILAHHSTPEFGSPIPPMFPEAEVVAQIDMLDARLYKMFEVCDSLETGTFSERQWSMENRSLFAHGHLSEIYQDDTPSGTDE